jgi:hypothetical protein
MSVTLSGRPIAKREAGAIALGREARQAQVVVPTSAIANVTIVIAKTRVGTPLSPPDAAKLLEACVRFE